MNHFATLARQLSVSLGVLLLAGCAAISPTQNIANAGLQGSVRGGQQPVSGATIQLYAVGTTGDGSASTPLLTTAVLSDAGGNFTITGDFTCPSATSLVYMVASGGNPGLGAGSVNPQLVLMVALGQCGNLTSSTFISINEVTTVGAVYSLAPYMASSSAIGSATTDSANLASAFTLASELVNPSTGLAPGLNVPAGTTVPVAQINTLADILAACINSAGGTSGDGSPCGSLFLLTTPTGGTPATDAVTALLHLVNNPALNTSSLFNLTTPAAPFQPTDPVAPSNFSVALIASSGLNVSPASLSFATISPGATSAAQAVTLTNSGNSTIQISGATFVGANPVDFALSSSVTSTCSTPQIAAGQSCTYQVVFAPSVSGARSAYLVIANNSPAGSIAIGLTGAGTTPPSVTLSPTSLTFYETGVPQAVTVTNAGNSAITIQPLSLSSNYSQINNCGTSLSAQSICTIYVSATQTGSINTGTLTFTDGVAADTQTVALTSNLNWASILAFPAGQVGVPLGSVQQLTGGVFSGTIGGMNFYDYSYTAIGMSDFPLSGMCSTHFGTTCSIPISFDPGGTGTRYAVATTLTNFVYLFKGFGFGTQDAFSMSPLATNFGNVATGTSASATITVSNLYLGGLTFSSPPTLTQGSLNHGEFTATSQCSTVQPNQSLTPRLSGCAVTVVFAPTTMGLRSTTMTLTDSAGTSQSVYLQGNGSFAPPSAPSFVFFGNQQYVAVNTSNTQLVTVTLPNQHAATAQLTANGNGAGLSAFSLNNSNCAQGASPCQFSVTVTPTAVANYTALLVVTDSVSGLASTSVLQAIGGIPVISLSPTSLTFLPRTVGTTSIAQTVTLTNMGNQSLFLNSIGVTGSNPQSYNQSNTCSNVLIAPGGTCTISVTNTPTAIGPSSAAITIVSNSSTSPDSIALSGSGT